MVNIQEWLELIKGKPYHSSEQSTTNPHGFVVGWKNGRGYVLGPYHSDEEINTRSMEFDPDKVAVLWSRYRQNSMVTRGVKHNKLESGEDIDDATKRMGHQTDSQSTGLQ